MSKIRWAICDDSEYIRFVYQVELSQYENLEFVGAISSAKECCTFLSEHPVDVLLLDVQLETETAGIDIIPEIRSEFPQVKIIILTSHMDENYIFEAFSNDANDYFLKTNSTDDLFTTIKNVYTNNNSLRPEIAKIITKKARDISLNQKSLLYTLQIMTELSTSEFEILKLVCNGYSYKEIASMRYVDLGTIKSHASRILKKFNTNNMKNLANDLNNLKIFDLFN